MTNGDQRRRRPADLDALAIKAARLYHEDRLDRSEIARQLGLEGGGKVASLLKRARDNGLVLLHAEDPSVPMIDSGISTELERVSGIRTVVAVRAPLRRLGASTASGLGPTRVAEGQVHQALAAAAAHFLWNRIRDYDHIFVGAGRAVRFTIDELRRRSSDRPRSFQRVEVTSLTGNPLIRRGPIVLDSDAISYELGNTLHLHDSAVHRVNMQYIARSPVRAIRDSGSTILTHWDRSAPADIAILGLGILDVHHHLMVASRLYRNTRNRADAAARRCPDQGFLGEPCPAEWISRQPASRDDAMMNPVKEILDQLEREVLPAGESPVMDVYDLFSVRKGALEPKVEELARELVSELNSRIVAAPRANVNRARDKVVIAGGRAKYGGILSLIRDPDDIGLRPTVLITDSETAAALISQLDSSRPGEAGAHACGGMQVT